MSKASVRVSQAARDLLADCYEQRGAFWFSIPIRKDPTHKQFETCLGALTEALDANAEGVLLLTERAD